MSEADQLGPSQDGTVVLDIGGDVGALVVHTDASMHMVEIEISPNDEHGEDVYQAAHPHDHGDGTPAHTHTPGTTHVAVRERQGRHGVRYAAIYPGLREGDYTLWRQDGTPADTVHVVGGQVTEYSWS